LANPRRKSFENGPKGRREEARRASLGGIHFWIFVEFIVFCVIKKIKKIFTIHKTVILE
jgi:hypothetical protein